MKAPAARPWLRPLADRPLVFVDVGARGGIPPHWQPVAPYLDVLAFEPDLEEARRLSASVRRAGARARVRPEALWEARDSRTLHITRNPGNSSVFAPRREFLMQFPDAARFDVVSTVSVATTTLDAVAADEGCTPRFAKIDAQGAALPILKGAGESLRGIVGLEVELEFVPMYDGESLFQDVDGFLRNRDFALIDLKPTYWRRKEAQNVPGALGQLVFCDALYIVSPAALEQRLAQASDDDALHELLSALVACEVYGLPDWASAFLDVGRRRKLRMRAGPPQWSRISSLPEFPLRYRLGLMLKDFADLLLWSRSSWAHAEQRIGGKLRSRILRRW